MSDNDLRRAPTRIRDGAPSSSLSGFRRSRSRLGVHVFGDGGREERHPLRTCRTSARVTDPQQAAQEAHDAAAAKPPRLGLRIIDERRRRRPREVYQSLWTARRVVAPAAQHGSARSEKRHGVGPACACDTTCIVSMSVSMSVGHAVRNDRLGPAAAPATRGQSTRQPGRQEHRKADLTVGVILSCASTDGCQCAEVAQDAMTTRT